MNFRGLSLDIAEKYRSSGFDASSPCLARVSRGTLFILLHAQRIATSKKLYGNKSITCFLSYCTRSGLRLYRSSIVSGIEVMLFILLHAQRIATIFRSVQSHPWSVLFILLHAQRIATFFATSPKHLVLLLFILLHAQRIAVYRYVVPPGLSRVPKA